MSGADVTLARARWESWLQEHENQPDPETYIRGVLRVDNLVAAEIEDATTSSTAENERLRAALEYVRMSLGWAVFANVKYSHEMKDIEGAVVRALDALATPTPQPDIDPAFGAAFDEVHRR